MRRGDAELMQPDEEVLHSWQGQLDDLTLDRPMNEKGTVFRVNDPAGRPFVLKLVEQPERAGGIEAQYRILRHLRESGVPAAPPIRTDAGECSVKQAGRVYTLSPYLPGGTFIAAEDLERAHRNVGRAIGRLHLALASYPDPIQSWTMDLTSRVFEQAVPIIRSRLDAGDPEHFEAALAQVEAEMRQAYSGLPSQYIHGDCHLANILIDRGEVSGFVDLDHLPMAPAVYDLGYTLADMVKRKVGNPEQTRQWRELAARVIAGYEEIRTLSRHERESIWGVMLAVQLLFTEFFLEQRNRAEAAVNLGAFFWLVEQRGAIVSR